MLHRIAAIALIVALAGAGTSAGPGFEPASHDGCDAVGHDCGQVVLQCCCDETAPASPQPSTPPSGRVHVSGLEVNAGPAIAFYAQPEVAAGLSLLALRRQMPPHGYPPADLRLLLSVFLI